MIEQPFCAHLFLSDVRRFLSNATYILREAVFDGNDTISFSLPFFHVLDSHQTAGTQTMRAHGGRIPYPLFFTFLFDASCFAAFFLKSLSAVGFCFLRSLW